ncbi:hypothetical protein BRYFOR_09865 [Marvinbryantia formatexigens DSM 14469]|uniref:AB hydrolase-1 domain-containing protein n=1 Tax=Marvinbryantia formatexigens DSM 14469 TaxID=478749 RepID=C6LMG4_9FIRM|nr:alpha/beta hydrolase [Marvinbryantia formatexigens]EET58190.1 hypothetical protein BRYFOR_09865 [Marvinbryantia formatexigens DSM 14469]UWO26779.1 alpha/beta hydrolase [Marvinbryantia formatexigens DSM 14469]SDH34467.1 hypothetical protein SAMN05660368_04181 [Marvinbryantia formatexigens]
MKKKFWLKLLLILVVLAAAVLLFAGNYLVDFAIVREENVEKDVAPPAEISDEAGNIMAENLAAINAQKEEWLAETAVEEVSITSEDGLLLKGDLFSGDEDSHRWLLAIHGYTGQRSDMQNIASFYGVQGYHVLTPDMRAHGESEGKYIGMGWLDRKDVLQWIDFILERDSQAEIILHGVSMGGATVMMVSGEELPENVKGIVEDCGYTSVWDIFADELAYLFHLPTFPVMDAANLVANIRAGYDFKEASAVKQVEKSSVPTVFIHGSEDNFVHTEMVYEVYEACTAPKELLVVEGAGHGQAYQMDPELYFSTVFDFLDRECF